MIRKMINQRISFKLKADHNFDWLKGYGNVFAVFDQQDSGNISFGLEKDGIKKFIKYAGARTINSTVTPETAVHNLKKSVVKYNELEHPHLVNLIDHFELENGYGLVYDWFDGENLHNHWAFPPPLKYEYPDSPFYRFKQLPVEKRLQVFKQILEFHVHVEQNGYVAIDFYDGSILYNFSKSIAKICDIDLYQRKPYFNSMGRMWGSSRFMSPEEFELGAVIDEKTNVFNMGAVAFCLFGGELNRSFEKGDVSKDLFEVALKAVENDREKRYTNVEEFHKDWMIKMEQWLSP